MEGDVLGPGGLPWDPGVGGGAAYDPSQEAGYLLDFWAEAGITEAGTGVSSWVDQASGLDVTQGTDANRPTYQATGLGGKPAVLFVAANSDRLFNSAFANASTDWTVYAFQDVKTTAADYRYLFDSVSGRIVIEQHTNTPEVGYFDGAHKGTGAPATGAQVTTWRLEDGGSGQCWRGSSSLGTATYTAKSMSGRFTIGSADAGTGQHMDAAIGRVLVFAAAHDAATRQRVWDWGASWYGITL